MEEQQKSWFGRNWPWVVPLGGCFTVILLFVFGIGAVIFGVSEVFTGSEPYEYAIERASANELVLDALGEPVETNGIMSGSLKFENDRGIANFYVPLKGSRGEGKVYIVGTKENGKWIYTELYVLTQDSEEHIDLLESL